MFNKRTSGMTLIETAVAVGLAAVFIAVSITIVLQAQATAKSAQLKNQSTIYAEQAKERVLAFKRKNTWSVLQANVRVNGWADVNINGNSMTDLSPSGLCNTTTRTYGIGGPFYQCITLKSLSDPRLIQVDIFINYLDRGSWKATQLSFYVSDT